MHTAFTSRISATLRLERMQMNSSSALCA